MKKIIVTLILCMSVLVCWQQVYKADNLALGLATGLAIGSAQNSHGSGDFKIENKTEAIGVVMIIISMVFMAILLLLSLLFFILDLDFAETFFRIVFSISICLLLIGITLFFVGCVIEVIK